MRGPAEQPAPLPETTSAGIAQLLRLRGFSRLWRAMLVSSMGDWVGFVAITSIVSRMGGDRAGYAIAGVMLARLLPSVAFGPFVGVLVDRFDRRRLMMTADLVRAAGHFTMPFLPSLSAIYAVSFLVESMSLLWSPSRDASIPNLVPRRQLMNAGTVVIATSYGTLPLSGLLFTGFVALGGVLGERIEFFSGRPEAAALFLDSLTFLFSAWMLRGLSLRGSGREVDPVGKGKRRAFGELAEGVRYLAGHPFARAMTIGIVLAFAGAGSVIALGPIFAKRVLEAGPQGWGILVTSLGIGMVIGMVSLRFVERLVARHVAFTASMISGSVVLLLLSTMPNLAAAAAMTAVMGASAGATWVSGYTLLQENVAEDLRGRTFGTLTVLVRLGLFVSLAGFPALSELLGRWVVSVGDVELSLPGARLALAAGALVILTGGLVARRNLVGAPTEAPPPSPDSPRDPNDR